MMSSDIRAVLAARAATYGEGTGAEHRLTQLHERIHRASRRRTTLAASATALVVVGVLVLGLTLSNALTGDRSDAPASLVGHDVPATTLSLGYTFRYTDSATGGDGRLDLHLGRSDQPRLVRWASESDTGELTVRHTGGDAPWVGPAGDFKDFVLIPQGAGSDVRLSQSGTHDPGAVALAVYTLDRAAPGVTRDGITYRADPAGSHLIGAGIGRLGQAQLEFRSTPPTTSRVVVEGFCVGPEDQSVQVLIGGKPTVTLQCSDTQDYDAAIDSSFGTYSATALRTTKRVQVRLTDEKGRASVRAGRSVRIGAALYAVGSATPARVVDVEGHRWERVDTRSSSVGAHSLRLRVSGARHSLLLWSTPGTKAGSTVTLDVGAGPKTIGNGGGNGGTLSGNHQLQGSGTIAAQVRGDPRGRIRLTSYRLAE